MNFVVSFLRSIALQLCFSLCLAGVCSAEVNVFIYHRFGDSRYPSTNISREVFAEQLQLLADRHYQVLPLSVIVNKLDAGEPLPDHCAVLTVDDGFDSFKDAGLPLLVAYGFPATLFVNTESVGRPGYLDWDELRELQRHGVEIGSHGHAHLHMTDMLAGESEAGWRRRIAADLQQANLLFNRELGKVPELFAYPYGEYSPAVISLVEQSGYKAAVAQQSGVVSERSNRFFLPRFPMGGGYATLKGFASKLQMRDLPVKVLAPLSPLIAEVNPPVLDLQIFETDKLVLSQLNCFVDGQPVCRIEADATTPGHYRITAEQALHGRRNKYTLTVPGKAGGWYWFSQLWITADKED